MGMKTDQPMFGLPGNPNAIGTSSTVFAITRPGAAVHFVPSHCQLTKVCPGLGASGKFSAAISASRYYHSLQTNRWWQGGVGKNNQTSKPISWKAGSGSRSSSPASTTKTSSCTTINTGSRSSSASASSMNIVPLYTLSPVSSYSSSTSYGIVISGTTSYSTMRASSPTSSTASRRLSRTSEASTSCKATRPKLCTSRATTAHSLTVGANSSEHGSTC